LYGLPPGGDAEGLHSADRRGDNALIVRLADEVAGLGWEGAPQPESQPESFVKSRSCHGDFNRSVRHAIAYTVACMGTLFAATWVVRLLWFLVARR
jgi:hypothetical protein